MVKLKKRNKYQGLIIKVRAEKTVKEDGQVIFLMSSVVVVYFSLHIQINLQLQTQNPIIRNSELMKRDFLLFPLPTSFVSKFFAILSISIQHKTFLQASLNQYHILFWYNLLVRRFHCSTGLNSTFPLVMQNHLISSKI